MSEKLEFMKLFILCDGDDCSEIAKRQFMCQDQFSTEYRLHLCEKCSHLENIKCKHKRLIMEKRK